MTSYDSPPSLVAGRGIGCGRIPDNRLLMDQLVPASYLQLEDTVRNLAIQMRTLHKPPVLTYKKLRYIHVYSIHGNYLRGNYLLSPGSWCLQTAGH